MTKDNVFWLSDEQIYKVWAETKEQALEVYNRYAETGEGPVKLKDQYIQVESEDDVRI